MRILYGVAGDGFGHASHADHITRSLEKNNHEVLIITSGRAHKLLKDNFNTFHIQGMYLAIQKGKVNPIKTVTQNIIDFPKNIPRFKRLKRLIKTFKPQLILTDYEPVTSYISILYNIPLISISNQNRFIGFDLPKTRLTIDLFLLKAVSKMITPYAKYNIALTLFPILTKKKNTYIASPIIRKEIKDQVQTKNHQKSSNKNKIVVYSHRKNKDFIDAIKNINENFIVFGYDMDKKIKNINYKKTKDFAKELASSNALISTSGFTSVGEAIFLKKPYLAIPQIGQYEQIYNAILIKRLKIGKYIKKITKKEIIRFIKNIPTYQKHIDNTKTSQIDAADVINSIIRSIQKNKQ